jgi:GNAT superfamily N-acetyltransferase
MPSPLACSLRRATPADETFLSQLYAGTRADELADTGWPDAQQQAFLQSQFAARQASYRAAFPGAVTEIILSGQSPVGAWIVHRASGEIRLVDMALLPAHRRKGIGADLLRRLQSDATASALPIRLHVVKNNPARSLYLRLGFAPAGETPTHLKMEWRSSPDSA